MLRRHLVIALGCAALLSVAVAPAAAASAACSVRYWQSSPYRNLGYDHVVVLQSACSRALSCLVSTNVAPRAVKVTLPANARRSLVTYRGAATPSFKARVSCR